MSINNQFNNLLVEIKTFLNPNTKYKNDNIEKSVLAAMFEDEELQQRGCQYLKSNDFFIKENQQVFNYILLLKKTVGSVIPHFSYSDLIANLTKIADKLEFNHVNEATISYIYAESFNPTLFLSNVEQLIDLTKMRNLEAFYTFELSRLQKNNENNFLWSDAYYNIQNFLEENGQNSINSSSFMHLKDSANELLKSIDEKFIGEINDNETKTKFHAVDYYVNSFKPGQLIILAARPGIGKTAFALNIARNIALENIENQVNTINSLSQNKKNRNVAFISLEMPGSELTSRFLSTHSQIELDKIQNPKILRDMELSKLHASTIQFNEMNVYFDDVPTSNIDEISWKIRKLNKDLNYNLNLVIVDYLQLIAASKNVTGNRQNEVSSISRQLKTLALELKIPILALSQLSRSVEHRENKTPQLSDLRESGAIEQDADIVIFLSKYNDSKNNNIDNEYNTIVTVAKNRNGQIGQSKMFYEGKIVSFNDVKKKY